MLKCLSRALHTRLGGGQAWLEFLLRSTDRPVARNECCLSIKCCSICKVYYIQQNATRGRLNETLYEMDIICLMDQPRHIL